MPPRADVDVAAGHAPARGRVAPHRLTGKPGAPGIGAGRLQHVEAAPAHAPVAVLEAATAGTAVAEEERLRGALAEAERQLAELARHTADDLGDEIGQIFEAQALFARDPSLVNPALSLIASGDVTAEVAFQRASDEAAAVLAAIDDEYLRERAADVRDVGRRVVAILEGRAPREIRPLGGSPVVIAADDLDASEVAVLRPQLVAGIALAGGAHTGHAAIVARAIGIPLVLALGADIGRVADGTLVAVDGETGTLLVEPTDTEIAELRSASGWAPVPGTPATETTSVAGDPRRNGSGPSERGNGLGVRVAANVGSVREAEQARALGANGIGLVRTELLFLGRSDPPGLDEQRALYMAIRKQMPGRSTVFRTLDIGGDKPGPLAPSTPEPNPALGVRGLRLGLRHPEVLEIQLRALLEASAGEQLDVMFPMVATLDELRAARAALDGAREASLRAGRDVAATVRVGIMVEVPSAAVMADVLAEEADFFSIGTNDLAQYTLAADRTHPELADLASALQPAVLRLVRQVVEAAAPRGLNVSVCGEAAGDPLTAPIFVGLGVASLSVAPTRLERLGRRLAGLSPELCREVADAALGAHSLDEVRLAVAGILDRL